MTGSSDGTGREPILKVRHLKRYFGSSKGLGGRSSASALRAVDDVSFDVMAGETLAVVGESGSGKTTLGRVIVRADRATDGEVWLKLADGTSLDLTKLEGRRLRAVRPNMHMVFQDPYSALEPRMTVQDIVMEPIIYNRLARGADALERARAALEMVGLQDRHMQLYPHAFSGGQRQRIGIARSLVCNPRLIVCDEAVSALDVSIQAQVLNLLQDMQGNLGLSYVFIAHNLAVVRHIAHRVAVMYVGKLVELSSTEQLFSRPRHPYTEALLSAIPEPDPDRKSARKVLRGETANPANPPSGCHFHPRCPYATDRCAAELPALREVRPGQLAACHYAEDLNLQGV